MIRLLGIAVAMLYEQYIICRGICADVCLPIAHAVNKFNTVLLALPLGLRISRLAPAMSNKYLLLSPVIKCLCHSII